MKKATLLFCLTAMSTTATAHESASLEDLFARWDMDPADTTVSSETLAPGLHVLFGAGGNVIVSIGDQGVLMVDSQFPAMIPKLQAEISKLGGGDIDFTINTHWHFDHADGNPTLGREGTWMVSHINSRRMMMQEYPVDLVSVIYDQPAYPAEGLPVITYDNSMQLHFNGERIDLMHFSPAHTTGDTAVIFRDRNVVHMGDVFNARYPFIDVRNGGDLDGMIEFIGATLAELNEDSVVVPGHGPVLAYTDMQQFHAMLKTIRGRIIRLIDDGNSLDDVIAAKPTAEFDERYGDPGLLINRAYHSLAK